MSHTKIVARKTRFSGLTWSGLSPGGTQVYSSKAHPESSSEWAKVCRGPLVVLLVALELEVALLVLLSIELFKVAGCWLAWWVAAMAALAAAAKGSLEWRLKELLWSSWGHLQFWQRGCLQLKKYGFTIDVYARWFVTIYTMVVPLGSKPAKMKLSP